MKFTFEELLKRRYCGARTRKGTPCKQLGIYENGRCKLHGGLSTGLITLEGKAKSALNGFKKNEPLDYLLKLMVGNYSK